MDTGTGTLTQMTAAQRAALEQEADTIRRYWLDPNEREFDEWKAQIALALTASTASQAQPNKLSADAYIENVKTQHNRPLGQQDVAHIAALTMNEWAPAYLVKTREQRRARKRLERQIRLPDMTGLSSPDEQALKENPDLAAKWNEQIKNGSAVFNPKR
jgi:transglutaminase/protease-like cytokinesis protein 3